MASLSGIVVRACVARALMQVSGLPLRFSSNVRRRVDVEAVQFLVSLDD